MATKSFKGFQLVALATFNGAGFTKDKNTLYFVRTSGEKGNGTDGFLYFNGKKYGTAEDAKAALTAKYGDLKIGEKDATIAEYVAAEIAKVNDAATTLEGKVTANTDAIKIINGSGDGSISKAVSDAKASLVGDAADGYNTLGKLEDKIQAEASRADAAEKANKDAAAAAKDAADAAQRTADAKVASVSGETGNAIKVDSTIATAPKVSLVLDPTQGNVKLSQSAAGLKAEVEIPAATVTAVKAGDKVLALEGTELTSTISLSVDTSADGEGKKYIRLKGIGGADLGKIDTADFVKDGMLEKAELVTNPSGQTEGTYIVLTWNTAAGKEAMPINVTSLIDVYTAGNGLNLSDHEFSVDTTKIATVELVNGVTNRVSTLEGKVATIEGEGEGSIKKAVADEASRAKAAEKINKDAIDKLNGDSGVTGSVDQKIKSALEAGAVTLEVKNNDKYLGVTSATTEGKGTVYTLASKADEIDKAIGAVKVSVASAEGAYVTASVDEAGRVITLREKVQSVEGSSTSAKGLAEASDVKNYVDQKVSDKNVSATGDTLVSASAAGNKVTVGATEALTSAVGKANSAVQSVNGKTGSTVTLTGADIATDRNVGESTNAKVNTVLADIYTKLGVVVKADNRSIKEAADHTLSVNLEATSDEKVSAGHIEIKQDADTGALYSMMYYSGDDVDAE